MADGYAENHRIAALLAAKGFGPSGDPAGTLVDQEPLIHPEP